MWPVDALVQSGLFFNKAFAHKPITQMTGTSTMEYSRISLRPFRLTDADDVLSWAGDDRVTRTTRWETLTSKEAALSFIKEVCIPQPWHVSICIDDRSIGFLWVIYPGSGVDKSRGDIGYAIAVEYWGQGIATKALKMAIPKVFNDFPEMVKLRAYSVLENKASQRVLEKSGFLYQRSVTFHDNFSGNFKGLTVLNVVIYRLLSTDIIPPSL